MPQLDHCAFVQTQFLITSHRCNLPTSGRVLHVEIEAVEIFRTHHTQANKIAPASRLSSFYAVNSVADAWRYVERHAFKGKPTIFAVHCDGPLTQLDMIWLNQQFPRNVNSFQYYYQQYWNGSHISSDQYLASHEKRGTFIEVLLSTPVKIGQPIAEASVVLHPV